jgi:hypothetical protein
MRGRGTRGKREQRERCGEHRTARTAQRIAEHQFRAKTTNAVPQLAHATTT